MNKWHEETVYKNTHTDTDKWPEIINNPSLPNNNQQIKIVQFFNNKITQTEKSIFTAFGDSGFFTMLVGV